MLRKEELSERQTSMLPHFYAWYVLLKYHLTAGALVSPQYFIIQSGSGPLTVIVVSNMMLSSFVGKKKKKRIKFINLDLNTHNMSFEAKGTFIFWEQILHRISVILENENLLGWRSTVLRDLTKNRVSGKFHRDAMQLCWILSNRNQLRCVSNEFKQLFLVF